jgi:DNA-binding cell septation regulator SpoVG
MTKTTREEKVAVQLMELISDIRLDITMIGMYIAKFARKGEWLRFEHIYHSAEEEQREDIDRTRHYTKMEDLGRHL